MSTLFDDWSNYDTEAKISQTVANYPSALSFFQMKETGTITSISDVISGAVVSSFNMSAVANNAIQENGGTAPSSDITMPDITSGYVVMIAIVTAAEDATLASFGYGDVAAGTTPYIGCYGDALTTRGFVMGDEVGPYTNYNDSGLQTSPSYPAAIGIYWEVGDNAATGYFDSTTHNMPKTGTMSTLDLTTDGAAATAVRFNEVSLASLALFNPSVAPSVAEMKSILAWTKYQHITANNKVICPYFIGMDAA